MKRIDPGYELADVMREGRRGWRRMRKAIKRNLKDKERTAARQVLRREEVFVRDGDADAIERGEKVL